MNKILFIRRDNIGDLICTTPAIHAVRNKFPDAKIGILVNTYNADVVINNSDIDEIYIYEKAKHVPDKNKLSVWWSNFKILQKIKKEKYDIAVGCGSYSPRLARYTFLTGAKTRIGYLKRGIKKTKSYSAPLYEPEESLHEVERTFKLLTPLGIDGEAPDLKIFPGDNEVRKARDFLNTSAVKKGATLIAFHISSRRHENRWPVERFTELGRLINKHYKSDILLLWSPGSQKNVYHPGDDEKADAVINSLRPQPLSYRTTRLRELIAVLSLADIVVCCDGGAMHVAAGLGKPVVAIWGCTDPERWRPWGAKHILLQDKSGKAKNVGAEEVFKAVSELLA
ncbi:MAG TPA: glycosyltransferase family 9 protein [Nitrospirae bacterium]|nr:lipopolysaccharide core heptosyltransferase RfaQ [bacterium BMS3Abin06]HDH12373.1 glycosyltransferase family 9 protein [Nitrospirota bacterium]HDZ01255.1 glycosyltransferase family 9 protein [Nitrospirota bacterium]